jgi:POT family proton-dependent oligopeptide transporter
LTAAQAAAPIAERTDDATFLGHPRGLAYLAFTEAWERFSYYGMSALLVLYMINQLLLPGHVEHVAGWSTFRSVIASLAGPLSTQALASEIFGLYSAFVYFTPVIGGFVGDRIGQRNAVVLGGLSMSGGHLAMAFDQSFLLALLLLILGSGLLKGNISAQVGGLYPVEDEERRSRGFAIFSTGINFGAVVGPLLCGYLGERYGWHIGFGTAAIFMLVGVVTYVFGYRYLPSRVERKARAAVAMTGDDVAVFFVLLGVMLITILPQIAYYQLANVLPVWLQEHGDMTAGSFKVPIPWFQSIDPLFSILCLPLLFRLWSWQGQTRGEPSELGKIGAGAFICGAANLVLVAAILTYGSGKVPWIWPLLFCAIQGVGFMYFWPPFLSLVSRASPPKINAMMMGGAFLVLFVANYLIGWIGTYYEQLGPVAFWSLHAAIGAIGGVLALLYGRTLGRILEPQPSQPPTR